MATLRQLQSDSVYSWSQSDTVIQNVISQKWTFKNTSNNHQQFKLHHLSPITIHFEIKKKTQFRTCPFLCSGWCQTFWTSQWLSIYFPSKKGKKINRALSCLLSENMCKPKQTGNRWRRQQQPLQPATSSNAGWPAGRKQVGHDDK